MERTNDHERAIAKTVDKKLVEYPGNHWGGCRVLGLRDVRLG